MATTTGIVLFDGAEELDFAGPWEVFTMGRQEGDTVVTIAEHERPITCAKGMRVLADHTFADAPALDVVLVPGGPRPQGRSEEPGDARLAAVDRAGLHVGHERVHGSVRAGGRRTAPRRPGHHPLGLDPGAEGDRASPRGAREHSATCATATSSPPRV